MAESLLAVLLSLPVGAALFVPLAILVRYKIRRIESREQSSDESDGGTGVASPLRVKICSVALPLIGAAAAGLSVYSFGLTPKAITVFAFIGVLAAVAATDMCTMEIPDLFNIVAAAVGVLSVFTVREPGIVSRLIGAVCVSVPLLIIALIIPGGFGGGDIKLTAACGIFLGWRNMLLSALIAVLAAGGYGAVLLAMKKADRKAHFAFGPFLCAGMAICCLYGDRIAALYMRVFDLSQYF